MTDTSAPSLYDTPTDTTDDIPLASTTPWLRLAREASGVKEMPGDHDNSEIMRFYRDAGHPEIRHDETAWCAAFACAMLERAGMPSPKTLSARDFMRWGKPLARPRPGAIAVFTRGDPRAYQGHVAFYLSEDATSITVLGGNQADAVGIARYPKARLLGYRWPVTATNSRTTKSVVVGTVGAVAGVASAAGQMLAAAPDQAVAIGSELKSTGVPWLAIIGSLLVVASLVAVALAHRDDLSKNGK